MMILSCLKLTWTHRIMQTIPMSALVWHLFQVVVRLWNLKEGDGVDCMVEIMFDIQYLPLPLVCGIPSA
jgi:hypothetical protein